jgi:hypothetical protein
MEYVRFIIGLLALVGVWQIARYSYLIIDTYIASKKAGAVIEYKIFIDPDKKV